jgi:CDP-4-dehydro-6-deoxyglucose reductase
MTARITCGENAYPAAEGETVLDCLTRNGVAVPHACKSGVCQACLMQADGPVPDAAQKGLKPSFVKQNLFLACQCHPSKDMSVRLPDSAGIDIPAVILRIDFLNHNVLRLDLKPDGNFPCEPGQYLTLINREGVARSYSIANNPAREGYIELHVRLLPNGLMSGYLKRTAKSGTALTIRGPAGSCFYVLDDGPDYPILLAGTGTGLAPLYGIARQAFEQAHRGIIHLFHGALCDTDLYLVDKLQALAARHQNFRYSPCVLNGEAGHFYATGNIEDIVMSSVPAEKASTRLFLCGAPDFVNALKRKAFLGGLASRHIFADAFLPSKPATLRSPQLQILQGG